MTDSDAHDHERLLSGHSGQVFVVLTAGFFVITMGRRLLPPLLPEIIGSLGITSFGAGIVLSVFTVVRAATQYPGGRYADELSRKTVLVGSFLLAIAGFGVLAGAINYATLLVGVAFIGAATGLFVPANRALLSDLYREKRGRAFGINMSASDVTGIVAAGLAIAVVGIATWQTAFLLVVVPVAVVLAAFWRTSRESLTLTRARFGLGETVGRLFGQRRFQLVVIAYSLRSFATSSVTNFLPVFLIATQGFSFEFASAAYALRFVVGIVAKPASGYLGDRISRPGIAIVSLVLTGGGIGLLVIAPTGAAAIGGVVLYAFGQKSFGAPMQAYLMDSFPDGTMGGDLGATRTTYMGVGSLGPATIGYLADAISFSVAYASTLLFLAVASGIVLWIECTGE
jgi:predicted MFS family arabinose efflux permease